MTYRRILATIQGDLARSTTLGLFHAGGTTPLAMLNVADRFMTRLLGYLRFRTAPTNHAMLFPRCRAVHTLGMAFTLDVFWLDSTGRVIAVTKALEPWRIARCPEAAMALEMPASSPASKIIRLHHEMEFRTCANSSC